MEGKYLQTLCTAIIVFTIILIASYPLNAAVIGTCSNCHTMHNSQDGSPQGSGPNAYLTVALNGEADPCVGCHSSSNAVVWKDPVTNAPIVWNQSEPSFNAQKGLAGGNFYWVGAGDSTKGHNVYGIAAVDGNLSQAPGMNPAGCSGSCHSTLAAVPAFENYYRSGCRGCHVFTYHHNDNGVYRFLKGHGAPPGFTLPPARKNISSFPDYVLGDEDSDWEQETTISHNWYKGTANEYSNSGDGLSIQKSITSFCSGCHSIFHGPYSSVGGRGMGSSSPWMRHPTDIALPATGEYAGYNPSTNYNAEAPVAWTNPTNTGNRGTAIVMCLSCHRAHGSSQPDILRWSYSDMESGTSDSAKAGKGCFVCHTQKDGI